LFIYPINNNNKNIHLYQKGNKEEYINFEAYTNMVLAAFNNHTAKKIEQLSIGYY